MRRYSLSSYHHMLWIASNTFLIRLPWTRCTLNLLCYRQKKGEPLTLYNEKIINETCYGNLHCKHFGRSNLPQTSRFFQYIFSFIISLRHVMSHNNAKYDYVILRWSIDLVHKQKEIPTSVYINNKWENYCGMKLYRQHFRYKNFLQNDFLYEFLMF